MDSLRVSIAGRTYEIPVNALQTTTIESLKGIMDAQNAINPRDLLRAFLENAEICATLKDTLNQIDSKLNTLD